MICIVTALGLAQALDAAVSAFFPLLESYRFDKPISLRSVRHHLVDFIYSADEEVILMRWFKDIHKEHAKVANVLFVETYCQRWLL